MMTHFGLLVILCQDNANHICYGTGAKVTLTQYGTGYQHGYDLYFEKHVERPPSILPPSTEAPAVRSATQNCLVLETTKPVISRRLPLGRLRT